MSNAGNRILDEFAKLATDAAGAAQGVKREVETALSHQVERILSRFDLVLREEFEVVKEMAAKARMDNDALEARIVALEELVNQQRGEWVEIAQEAEKAD